MNQRAAKVRARTARLLAREWALWDEGRQLGAAVRQVTHLNDQAQIEAATAILTEARKRIYGLLAE